MTIDQSESKERKDASGTGKDWDHRDLVIIRRTRANANLFDEDGFDLYRRADFTPLVSAFSDTKTKTPTRKRKRPSRFAPRMKKTVTTVDYIVERILWLELRQGQLWVHCVWNDAAGVSHSYEALANTFPAIMIEHYYYTLLFHHPHLDFDEEVSSAVERNMQFEIESYRNVREREMDRKEPVTYAEFFALALQREAVRRDEEMELAQMAESSEEMEGEDEVDDRLDIDRYSRVPSVSGNGEKEEGESCDSDHDQISNGRDSMEYDDNEDQESTGSPLNDDENEVPRYRSLDVIEALLAGVFGQTDPCHFSEGAEQLRMQLRPLLQNAKAELHEIVNKTLIVGAETRLPTPASTEDTSSLSSSQDATPNYSAMQAEAQIEQSASAPVSVRPSLKRRRVSSSSSSLLLSASSALRRPISPISRTYFPTREERKGGENPMAIEEKDDSKSEGSSITPAKSPSPLPSIVSDASEEAREEDTKRVQHHTLPPNYLGSLPREGEYRDDSMEDVVADPGKDEVVDSPDSSPSLPIMMADPMDLFAKRSESSRDDQLSPPTGSDSTVSSSTVSSNVLPDFLGGNENVTTTMKPISHQRSIKRPRRVLATITSMNTALETIENESGDGLSALRGNHKRRRSCGEEDGEEEEQQDTINNEENEELKGATVAEVEEERVPEENDSSSQSATVSSNIGTAESGALLKRRSGRVLKAFDRFGFEKNENEQEYDETKDLHYVWNEMMDNVRRAKMHKCCALKKMAENNRDLVRLLPSSIINGGEGLILRKNAAVGTVLTEYDGVFGTLRALRRGNPNESHYMIHKSLGVGYDGHPDEVWKRLGRKLEGLASMANHSRHAPNCVMIGIKESCGKCKAVQFFLVSKKELKKGMECFWNYGKDYRTEVECEKCKKGRRKAEMEKKPFQPCPKCLPSLFLDDSKE